MFSTGKEIEGQALGRISCMTRSELITALAARSPHLDRVDVELVVKSILEAMSETLGRSGRIEIRGFGAFTVVVRNPRTGRNPKTGDNVAVPATAAPQFKAGKDLVERVRPTGTALPRR